MRDGKRFRTSSLDVRVVRSTGAMSRIGFVVPKYGHSSAERNRLKRRLRELSRREVLDLIRGVCLRVRVDVVMRAHPGAYRLEFAQLRSEIDLLRGRLEKLLRHWVGEARAGEAVEPPST